MTVHQEIEDIEPRALLLVTDDTTRAEIEEALGFITQALHRMPSHWTERRAALHAKIDALLVDWQKAQ